MVDSRGKFYIIVPFKFFGVGEFSCIIIYLIVRILVRLTPLYKSYLVQGLEYSENVLCFISEMANLLLVYHTA